MEDLGIRVDMLRNSNDVVTADLQYICKNLEDELSQMAGKNLLIVGGGGFLGYYLVQTILFWNKSYVDKRIRIYIIDNFIRGRPQWLVDLEEIEYIFILERDITLPLNFQKDDYQYIIHAASIASPNFYRKFPIETMDANVNGLRNLLDYSREKLMGKSPIMGFLYFSTSEIYGDPPADQIPTHEDYRGNVSCTGPRACYDESKRFGETLCVNFAQQYGLPIKIARPFNNYGPGLKITDRRVISDFARDIFEDRNIVLLSDGSPTRTFCYVADAVVGYYKILISGETGSSYNIGTEVPEISMLELAERMVHISKRLFNYAGSIERKKSEDKNYLVDNPIRRCPSIAKAASHLGYQPKISLEEGLERALLWYSENVNGVEA